MRNVTDTLGEMFGIEIPSARIARRSETFIKKFSEITRLVNDLLVFSCFAVVL